MIDNINDYFAKGCGRCNRFATPGCSVQQWGSGLKTLRRICLDMGLFETVKWGHPCYIYQGSQHKDRNIVILGAFRDDFRINFFNPALMKDPEGVLEKRGPNTQTAGMISFTDNAKPGKMEPTIRAYIKEAIGYADAGVLAPKQKTIVPLPDEMIDVLNTDPELAEAFHSLTPGRQKSYAINLNSAKKPETRYARIAKFRGKILAGKGALER